MRLVTKIIKQSKVVEVEEMVFSEEFTAITDMKNVRTVRARSEYKNSSGEVIGTEEYEISGTWYDLLMSESPEFAPGKPANEYRETDLWHIIELIHTENDL